MPIAAQIVALLLGMLGIEMTQDERDSLVSAVTALAGALGAVIIAVGGYFQRRKDKQ